MTDDNRTPNDQNGGDEPPAGVSEASWGAWHRRVLEGRAGLFALLTVVAISIGGLVEIIPMFTATDMGVGEDMPVTPYTPLEVAGRDLYVREGCYLCHSQMVRPMRAEVLRYGEWSRAWEYRYDRPFLLGSRRLGPDLHRIAGKYPDAWHYEHMEDPRSTSPGSIMPAYPWMLERTVDPRIVAKSLRALQRVGHPYVDVSEENVRGSMRAQGSGIVNSLAAAGIESEWDTEIVAMIAYLQRLGRDGKAVLSGASGQQQEQ
ncbi:MAG TPA: cytochrome-c oxidase, cbb3-type subunit II [Longimicrobiales bacterium]|nr:cytochrome-c oxidase, cbb3-type subunit II [Longimicrobiales bacterium]